MKQKLQSAKSKGVHIPSLQNKSDWSWSLTYQWEGEGRWEDLSAQEESWELKILHAGVWKFFEIEHYAHKF